MKMAYWVCGIEKQAGQGAEEPKLSEEEAKAKAAALIDIHEKPKWKQITNINAIILCTVAIFFCGFFY